jgi:LysM repeat protein
MMISNLLSLLLSLSPQVFAAPSVDGPLLGSLSNLSRDAISFRVMPLGQAVTILSHAPPYVVKSGDTLYDIAHRFGISLACLEASNPKITDPNLIFPGEVVYLASGNDEIEYKVMPGDFMYSIANQFGVTLDDLESANRQITDPDLIYPGQILNIPNVCSLNVDSALFPCGGSFYHLNQVSKVFKIERLEEFY